MSAFDIYLPLIISNFLKSIGAIFFAPSNVIGAIILVIILITSRIMFIMAILGYYFGVLFQAILIKSFNLALNDLYAFNYILTSISLCGIFLLPTIRSFFITILAIMCTVITTNFFEVILGNYYIPVFTLPFNLVTISFIFTLKNLAYKELNYNLKTTPEQSLKAYLNSTLRFGHTIKISLPFSGKWYVYQEFNDKWTHKGKYKFAYDFVKKQNNQTYIDDPTFLDNYLCFGESILSPTEGYIVDCRHDLIDQPIGITDKINNWGNYVTIKNHQGIFIKICHLMQFSLTVKIGDYVRINDTIAKCGNSGYSPEPHIHIQVQDSNIPNAHTKEFCFDKYHKNNFLYCNGLPQKKDDIESIVIDKFLKSKFSFILDDEFKYEVFEKSIYKEEISLKVKMNTLGEFYFEDNKQNKLYFYDDRTEFYFYTYTGCNNSHLQKLFVLSPKIPYISKRNIYYSDFLPIDLIKGKFYTKWITFISIFNKKYSKNSQRYSFHPPSICSKYGEVKINTSHKGFEKIKYGSTELVLKKGCLKSSFSVR